MRRLRLLVGLLGLALVTAREHGVRSELRGDDDDGVVALGETIDDEVLWDDDVDRRNGVDSRLHAERKAQEAQIEALLRNMTRREKLGMLSGSPDTRGYTGYVPGVARLAIPALRMNDGPQGFRGPAGASTAWPCALALAATFSSELAYLQARAMAREFRVKGANVFLGPGVNVARVPTNGRNFEYLSGEDAFLGEEMTSQYVRGIQSVEGLMATVKHYVNNNQETNRGTVSARVDPETERNIYYRPFRAGVAAGAFAVMCSYNKINGVSGCSSNQTINLDLKTEMGFEGLVMSDWFASRDTVRDALAGMDLEMPIPLNFGVGALEAALASGRITSAVVDEKVRRILRAMIRSGAMRQGGGGGRDGPGRNATNEAHAALARRVSGESVVLLKNARGLLPLSGVRRVVVIGDRAHLRPIVVGQGSGHVEPPYVVTPFIGLRGAEALRHSDVTYVRSSRVSAEKTLIAQADAVIVVVGVASSEGFDRPTLALDEDHLVLTAAGINSNVAVCVVAPGAVLLPWADHPNVSAVIVQFMPGQEGGNALADVIVGARQPTGRLPVTMPWRDNEMNMTQEQYPGRDLIADYAERTLVGYRWYTAAGFVPRFAFGFGLGYHPKGPPVYVSARYYRRFPHGIPVPRFHGLIVEVQVRSSDAGVPELVQVYAAYPTEPVLKGARFLVGFTRAVLARGLNVVRVPVRRNALAVYSSSSSHAAVGWHLPKGLRLFAGPDSVRARALEATEIHLVPTEVSAKSS